MPFDDHHVYRPSEMRRLAQQFLAAKAEAALTTEKDAINIGFPVDNIYWLEVAMEVEKMDELVELIGNSVRHRVNDIVGRDAKAER